MGFNEGAQNKNS